MSGRFVAIVSMVSMVAIVLAVTALTADTVQAMKMKKGTTVIVKCTYDSDLDPAATGFATQVAGVETAGPRPPHFETGMSCAEAFNRLNNAGFKLVHSGPIVQNVDGNDFLLWQRG